MARLSPKIVIINYFDELINRVDIDIDQSIEKFKENQLLGELKCFQVVNRIARNKSYLEYFDSNEQSQENKCDEWSESTKVTDYLNQVRQRTINELSKAQEDSIEYLKSKSCDLNQLKDVTDIDEMRNRLFAEKFYFQVLFKPQEKRYQDAWVFDLFTVVVDFYLSHSDIKFLELLINAKAEEIMEYCKTLIYDEKIVLIQSIHKNFLINLTSRTQQYPNHVLNFNKKDLLNIKAINYSCYMRGVNLTGSKGYLSNLESLRLKKKRFEEVKIDGFSHLQSLELVLSSIEEPSSFHNLFAVRDLTIDVRSEINNDSSTKLLEIFPNIESLNIHGKFSNINLDRFVNLKTLSIYGLLLNDFNFDLFKNICNQLEYLKIRLNNLNDENISKLLIGHNFLNVLDLEIFNSKIIRLNKKLFDGFPNLQSFYAKYNQALKTIDKDAFSNLKNLKLLGLNFNNQFSELDPELFSYLENLEKLDLRFNILTRFDLKIFDYINKIKEIDVSNHRTDMIKIGELITHCRNLNIKLNY